MAGSRRGVPNKYGRKPVFTRTCEVCGLVMEDVDRSTRFCPDCAAARIAESKRRHRPPMLPGTSHRPRPQIMHKVKVGGAAGNLPPKPKRKTTFTIAALQHAPDLKFIEYVNRILNGAAPAG